MILSYEEWMLGKVDLPNDEVKTEVLVLVLIDPLADDCVLLLSCKCWVALETQVIDLGEAVVKELAIDDEILVLLEPIQFILFSMTNISLSFLPP